LDVAGLAVGTGVGDLVDLALAFRGDLVDLALGTFTAVGSFVLDDFGALACAKLNIKIARMPMASSSGSVMLIIVPVWVGERDREGGVRTVKNRITTFFVSSELLHEVPEFKLVLSKVV
jgi:hypothetical protein